MSIETPGDNKRCDHCNAPGQPYEYRGQKFSGLIARKGERLCRPCCDAIGKIEGVDILVTDGRPGIPDRIYNTVRDADLVFPRNPGGIDGRDLPRFGRSRRKHPA
jgi:hypothetical protein